MVSIGDIALAAVIKRSYLLGEPAFADRLTSRSIVSLWILLIISYSQTHLNLPAPKGWAVEDQFAGRWQVCDAVCEGYYRY